MTTEGISLEDHLFNADEIAFLSGRLCDRIRQKNGTTSPTVFKLKKLTLEAGQSTTLAKTHPLRADATTSRSIRGPTESLS